MPLPPLPPFSALPLKKDGPPYNAWGLYGDNDELGRLNLITPEVVQKGIDSVKHGVVVNLNLPLINELGLPGRGATHEIKVGPRSLDDILHFNTQASSQWDGLRHFPYQNWPEQGDKRYYGGMTFDEAQDDSHNKLGTQNYVRRPITSRAHLLDIPLYLSRSSLPPLSYTENPTPVTVSMLKGCVDLQGNKIEPGDVLMIRTGWTEVFEALSTEEKAKWKPEPDVGVERGEEMLRWHWELGVAAVAGDVRAYEQYPWPKTELANHEVFLSGWGMPIGELFDFRELSKKCQELEQWTFLVTSMVLNVHAGIASPPNAQAIL